jgi:4-hydroxythreonine-4-phosphate dehydrogenase
MTRENPAIAITVGEPAGVGPELIALIAARHAASPFAARLVVVGDHDLLVARAARIGVDVDYARFAPGGAAPEDGRVEVWHHPLTAPVVPGQPDPANSHAVLATLAHAADACATGAFAALVTAPVQKSALADAGIAFMGHTEYFAQRTHTPRVVMMLVGGEAARPLRVALVTTHLALKDVAAAITRLAVDETIAIVASELATTFGIAAPRIGVCGLNPHSGEGGHLGREEIDVIAPSIAAACARGVDALGPVPADTVFVPSHAKGYDAIIAMYHDQGLPVLKAASFGGGVNVTLGLPFIRTSVDHGTALDLAADAGRARGVDAGSLVAALELAITLAQHAGA